MPPSRPFPLMTFVVLKASTAGLYRVKGVMLVVSLHPRLAQVVVWDGEDFEWVAERHLLDAPPRDPS